MTVSVAGTLERTYAGNGATTAFSYPVRFSEASEIVVTLRSASGVDTVKALTTHYTLSASPWTSGATVTFVTAPAAGETVIIYRETLKKQVVDLANAQRNDVDAVETQLDRMSMADQDMSVRVSRSWKADYGATGGRIVAGADGTVPKFDGGNLVEGPTADEIENAQGYAEQTAADLIETGLAKDIAKDARDQALAAAAANIATRDTQAVVAATALPAGTTHVRVAGLATVGDGGGSVFKKVSSEPAHPAKIHSSDSQWLEWSDYDGRGYLPTSIFAGGVGAQFNQAVEVVKALRQHTSETWLSDALGIRIKPGTYVLDETLVLTGSSSDFLPNLAVNGTGVQRRRSMVALSVSSSWLSRICWRELTCPVSTPSFSDPRRFW